MIGTESYRISIHISQETPQPPDSAAPDTAHYTDYRVSEISVFGFDFPKMAHESLQDQEPLRARSLGNGAIRLYRDFEHSSKSTGTSVDAIAQQSAGSIDDTMVSILALPTYFTATDLLGFIGDNYIDNITHIRVLKSEKPNRFLVLLKFNDAVTAADFQFHFDGKPFNSMEPETCHVVFLKSVTFDDPDADAVPNSEIMIPFLLKDPFTSSSSSSAPSDSQDSSSSKPSESHVAVELPTCPVCLERLDSEVSGLLTIPCQHTFHCQCLSKWRDDTCPVCRYTNSISNQKIRSSVRRLSQINSRMQQQQQLLEGDVPAGSGSSSLDSGETCMQCDTSENLWVCLICGNIGCDRYAPEQHSLKHFIETGHCFAMELESSRIWDYAGDRYVHRLITSETDGKIVEIPEKEGSESKPSGKGFNDGVEYSELLLSQLVSQREYYELLLNEKNQASNIRRRSSAASTLSKTLSQSTAETEKKVDELTAKLDKMNTNVIPALKQKIRMSEVSLKVASGELEEANALNEGLSQKVEYLIGENEKLRAQNEELSDQVKDLMFYLEAQEKFKDQPPEVTEGQVVMKPKKSGRRKR